jgi:hypothetical protein
MKKYVYLLPVAFLVLTSNIFTQETELSSGAFFAKLRAADELKENVSRRETMTIKVYSDGKLNYRKTEIDINIKPDRRHFSSVEENDGKLRKLERIIMGSDYYRKIDDGVWTKEDDWNEGSGFFGIPVPFEEKFTVEDSTFENKPVKIYRWYAVYKEHNPKEGEDPHGFYESSMWIDKNGYELKSINIMGKPRSKEITSERSYLIEYDPQVEIETPKIEKK